MKYLYEKGNKIYAKCENCDRILKFNKYEINEVKTGVECFCGNMSNQITGMPQLEKPMSQPIESVPASTTVTPVRSQQQTGPRCPTCGSTRVKKISLSSKVVGGAMVGLFSSNIRNTFKCESCGYKW